MKNHEEKKVRNTFIYKHIFVRLASSVHNSMRYFDFVCLYLFRLRINFQLNFSLIENWECKMIEINLNRSSNQAKIRWYITDCYCSTYIDFIFKMKNIYIGWHKIKNTNVRLRDTGRNAHTHTHIEWEQNRWMEKVARLNE